MARSTRRGSQAVTIQAVAEKAGVSAMTISNVINGTGKVGDTTRAAVLAVIKDLGYKPNMAAQALASAGANRIGMIYVNRQNAFLSAMLVGTLHATAARGVQLIIREHERPGYEGLSETLHALVRSGANGLLLTPPYSEMVSGMPLLHELGVPIAAVATGTALPDLITVRVDDMAAMQAMTDLLIDQGHRRIGFITGPNEHSSSAARRKGYERSLQAHGLPLARELLAPGDFTFESGLSATEQLLKLDNPPSAIVASSDDMAAAVVSVAHRRSLDVPNDLAVTGFDDTPIATKIWPPLTTINQPIADMAELATLALIARLRNDSSELVLDHIVDFRLIERNSTRH